MFAASKVFRVLPFAVSVSLSLAAVCGEPLTAADLSGRVSDAATGQAIRDVNLRVLETGQLTSTDNKGVFGFKGLADGDYHLIATHVNYQISDTILARLPASPSVEISINPVPWVLNEVVVTGTRSPHLLKDVPVQTEVVTLRDFQRTGAHH